MNCREREISYDWWLLCQLDLGPIRKEKLLGFGSRTACSEGCSLLFDTKLLPFQVSCWSLVVGSQKPQNNRSSSATLVSDLFVQNLSIFSNLSRANKFLENRYYNRSQIHAWFGALTNINCRLVDFNCCTLTINSVDLKRSWYILRNISKQKLKQPQPNGMRSFTLKYIYNFSWDGITLLDGLGVG